MIVSANRIFEHEGKTYHIQIEDLGTEQAVIEARVYDGGSILWRRRVPYADILAKGLEKLAQDDELRSLMDRTLHTVQAAIAKGKLG
jgi:hypothetical protein